MRLKMLKVPAAVLLYSVFAVLVLLSLINAFFDLRASAFLSAAGRLSAVRAGFRFSDPESDPGYKAALRATQVIKAPAGSFAALAARLIGYAGASPDYIKRSGYYCAALHALSGALSRDPLKAAYLINWAVIRQILGEWRCAEPGTEGSHAEAAEAALFADPLNPDVLFEAGKIYLTDGERARAFSLFRELLSVSTDLPAAREDFILSGLQSPEELLRLVPPRFPQAAVWSELFRKRRPDDFELWKDAFTALQIGAINAAAEEYGALKAAAALHRRRMFSVLPSAAGSAVRQRADQELARVLRESGEADASDLFAARSLYQTLRIVRGKKDSDRRPQKTMLAGWAGRDPLAFDTPYTSVGFFTGERQSVKLIQLTSQNRLSLFSPRQLRVWASNNNREWRDISAQVRVTKLSPEESDIIAITTAGLSFRYWKINFPAVSGEKVFINTLSALLGVYGYSEEGR